MPSIRQKITYGFYLFAAIIVGLAVFAYLDLHFLEQRIQIDETVSRFFDTTLEMRRNEKNYFLYGEEADYQEALRYARQAGDTLVEHSEAFLNYADRESIDQTQNKLAMLQTLFQTHRAASREETARRAALEKEIRAIGRDISLMAGTMSKAERADMRAAVQSSRHALTLSVVLLSIFGVVVGQVLSRRVVRPLRLLEESMRPIAKGVFNKLDIPVKDREIVSFTAAFNRMLQEHDLHLQHLIQSEKLASLGTLVSGVAHELNNPLSNISTSCQILLEELKDPSADVARQQELLQQIDEQTERARSTVLALLDFSRQSQFHKEPVVFRDLVRQTLVFLKRQIPPEVSVEIVSPEDLVLQVDRRKLQQAMLNLIKNAVDAMGGTGVVTIRIQRFALNEHFHPEAVHVYGNDACDAQGETVVISVEDNGPGIPPDVLPRIFDPFFTTRDVGQGSGLGLFIVLEIVQQHQGCIGVISEAGKGTTFFIKLPYETETGTIEDNTDRGVA